LISIRDEAENHTKEFKHTITMLKQLKETWYKIWLISNCSIFALEKIKEKTKILDYIDYPLFSFEVGIIKPNLKIFEKMLEISWCKPEETIMIWDKIWDDVLPPKQLGISSLLYENYEQLKKDLLGYGVVLQ
jgi:FMN phosphatase YigB (HAD superfamily)